MTVLVVGGAGYIGSHAARCLRQHGYDVLIYDNLSTGYRVLANGFELIEGDIADGPKLGHVMKRVEAVMHFAAYACVGESVGNPRKYFQNNVASALTLLNAAIDAGVRTFVFSSTCAVYGTPSIIPIAEDTPRQPVNPYGVSKLFIENALEAYGTAYDLRYANLRYFNAAGADERGGIGELHDPETHLIPLALAAASGAAPELQVFGSNYPTADGTCVRDYIHVNDLAEAHVLALQHLIKGGAPLALNLGTGEGYSVKQVLATVHEVTGTPVPYQVAERRPGDPPALVADPARAKQVLHWRPTRGLRDIISTSWNWMMQCTSASETLRTNR